MECLKDVVLALHYFYCIIIGFLLFCVSETSFVIYIYPKHVFFL